MIMVKKQKGESDDKLIYRFRKKIINEGYLKEIQKKKHFISASERRKEKKYQKQYMIDLEKSRE